MKTKKFIVLSFLCVSVLVIAVAMNSNAASSPRVGDVLGAKNITIFDYDENGFQISGTSRVAVKYAYVAGRMNESISQQARNEAQKDGFQITGEVVSARTPHARTFKTANPKKFVTEVIAGSPQYYKDDNGIWWQANYDITTPKNFISLPKSPLFTRSQSSVFAFIDQAVAFYPDANEEDTSVDGYVYQEYAGAGADWSTLHGGSGSHVNDSDAQTWLGYVNSRDTQDKWRDLIASIFLFDTSLIPDNAVINSATFSVYGTERTDNYNQYLTMTDSNPASSTSLAVSDYQNRGTAEQASNRIDITNFTPSGYNYFTLNATGLGNINKTGVSKFGTELSCDLDNSEPTWQSVTYAYARGYSADQTDTDKDPKLVVVYITPSFRVRKPIDQSRTDTTTPQADSELALGLEANQTYMIEGVIFASSTDKNPDIKIAFNVPTGAIMDMGFIAASDAFRYAEMLEDDSVESGRIPITADTPVIIQVTGTIKMGASSGNVELWWAQASADADDPTTVRAGSYLRADAI
jgi:hypothetical protein